MRRDQTNQHINDKSPSNETMSSKKTLTPGKMSTNETIAKQPSPMCVLLRIK